jgi:hypothetical protein
MKATHNQSTTAVIDPQITPADLLRGAALYLQHHGWTQGELFDYLTAAAFPPACAIGALNAAAYGRCMLTADDDTDESDAWGVLTALRVFAASIEPDYDPFQTSAIDVIGGWNDEKDRTVNEVVQALTEAADDWDTAHPTGGAR